MQGPYRPVDTGKVLKVTYAPLVTVRENVTVNDSGNPSNTDVCHDFTGWEVLDIYIKVSGTDVSWDITPIFGDGSDDGVFYDGVTITVTGNEMRRIQGMGAPCVYFRCDGASGTNPKIESIAVRPVNGVH